MNPLAIPPDPAAAHLNKVPAESSYLIQVEVEDLERELRAVRRKERWHFVWALTGISPAALIPAIGLFREGSFGWVVLLAFLVTISQFYLGVKASGKAARLKKSLEGLREKE